MLLILTAPNGAESPHYSYVDSNEITLDISRSLDSQDPPFWDKLNLADKFLFQFLMFHLGTCMVVESLGAVHGMHSSFGSL